MEAKLVEGEPLYFSADMLTDWQKGDTDEIYAFKVVRAVQHDATVAEACRMMLAVKRTWGPESTDDGADGELWAWLNAFVAKHSARETEGDANGG
jgi:hypothetical protein